MKKRLLPEEPKAQGDAEWLCTFNDLMTLLMVFFVLLFSMSSISDPRFENLSAALQSGLGVLQAGDQTDVAVSQPYRLNGSEVPMLDRTENPETKSKTSREIAENIVQKMKEAGNDSLISAGEHGEIRLESGILFKVGEARIDPKGRPILDAIAEELRKHPHHIRVEGHTDNFPIQTMQYPTNWELSAQRAVNVVKYLVAGGGVSPFRLSAVGYGASKPCSTNLTPEGREKNRRVEIILVEGKNNE